MSSACTIFAQANSLIMAEMKLFSGTNSRYVAQKIADALDVKLGKINIQRFADGEFEVCYEEPVRGAEVYLVQSTCKSTENLMELLLMIDAAKRASAHSVIAVIPYFGWARQDRKDKPRVSIAAKLVANILIAAGIDRLITMDLHADQIQGFFDVPVDHLYASTMFVPDIESLNLKDMVIASPDVGGAKRANSYAKYFNAPLVLCHKQRLQARPGLPGHGRHFPEHALVKHANFGLKPLRYVNHRHKFRQPSMFESVNPAPFPVAPRPAASRAWKNGFP